MSDSTSSDALHLSPQQSGDIQAADKVIYAEAADKVFDNRTLGRDLLALAGLFFVIVTYHLQNPVLREGTQFGSAFRNASLQVAMVIALVVCAAALINVQRRALRYWRSP